MGFRWIDKGGGGASPFFIAANGAGAPEIWEVCNHEFLQVISGGLSIGNRDYFMSPDGDLRGKYQINCGRSGGQHHRFTADDVNHGFNLWGSRWVWFHMKWLRAWLVPKN